MKTGFRLAVGGFQEVSGITPDLATFGKAMANGFPLAAVVGRAAIMEEARRTWISSTLAGESTSIAAAWATLNVYEEEDVCGTIATAGGVIRAGVARAITASGIDGVTVDGLDPMWLLRFEDPSVERRFLELAVGEGVLFKRGAYNYAALPHADEEVIVDVEHAASSAFVGLLEELRG
jgi:glutamate-1-semialdehyde aminotransferase